MEKVAPTPSAVPDCQQPEPAGARRPAQAPPTTPPASAPPLSTRGWPAPRPALPRDDPTLRARSDWLLGASGRSLPKSSGPRRGCTFQTSTVRSAGRRPCVRRSSPGVASQGPGRRRAAAVSGEESEVSVGSRRPVGGQSPRRAEPSVRLPASGVRGAETRRGARGPGRPSRSVRLARWPPRSVCGRGGGSRARVLRPRDAFPSGRTRSARSPGGTRRPSHGPLSAPVWGSRSCLPGRSGFPLCW